ncbi:hypothetical protein AAG906_013703 [Vitis piasezkii]
MYICLFSNECRSKRKMPSLYPHAEGILYALKEKELIWLSLRDHQLRYSKTFLDKLGIKSMLVAQEIFSSLSHKTQHFQIIHRTGVSKMRVTSILVGNGLNIGALSQGLTKFSQNSASSGNTKRN